MSLRNNAGNEEIVVPIQRQRDICAECAVGHHIYCLDDGSSTITCDCPCSDDFDPDAA